MYISQQATSAKIRIYSPVIIICYTCRTCFEVCFNGCGFHIVVVIVFMLLLQLPLLSLV